MKLLFAQFGLLRGAQVTLEYEGRTLLGDVRGTRYDDVRGCVLLTVTHFNGDPWPIEPAASAVDVLTRSYTEAPQ